MVYRLEERFDNIGMLVYNTIVMVEKQEKVQLLMKVPKQVKLRAQKQADLAYEYKWITSPTVTQLFIWVVNKEIDKEIRNFIIQRRYGQVPSEEAKQKEEVNQ